MQAIAIGLTCLLAGTSHAGLLVTIEPSGSNVTATLSGSFVTLPTPFTSGNSSFPTVGINPGFSFFEASDTAASPANFQVHNYNYSIPFLPAFGPGGLTAADTTTASTKLKVARNSLQLLQSYTPGTVFSGVMTWNNASIASLGLTEGTYSSLLSGGGAGATVTVNVVPEPSSIALLGFAGIAAAAALRFRQPPGGHHRRESRLRSSGRGGLQ